MESNASEVTPSSSSKPRKRQEEEESIETPPSKKTKPDEDETGPDFSKLPVEVLEILCKFVDKESRKALGGTCKLLYLLSVPEVLRLDFDRIKNESGNFPNVNRAHQALRLAGAKVRGTRVQFDNALQSSQNSTKTLSIGEGCNLERYSDEDATMYCRNWLVRRYGTQLSFQRFQFLLLYFPNLTTVELRGVSTVVRKVMPPLELPKLKILRLEHIEDDVLSAFGKVKTLEELDIGNCKPARPSVMQELIYTQKELTSLKIRSISCSTYFNRECSMIKLRKITSVCMFRFFQLAPNLEYLRLDFKDSFIVNRARGILKQYHSTKLKTLILNPGNPERDLVEELRSNFPMLEAPTSF